MKTKSLIMVMVLLCIVGQCVIGQIEEIKSQNIQMGDYIKQNAVLQYNPPNGAIYFKPCLDCTAQITVYDDKNNVIIYQRPMIDLTNAQFGYLTSYNEFSVNIKYRVVVNFTSSSLGSGITSSSLYITQNTKLQTNNNVNTVNTDTTEETNAPGITKYSLSSISILVADMIAFIAPVWNTESILSTDNLIALAKTPFWLIMTILDMIGILKIFIGVLYILLILFDVSITFLGYLTDVLGAILLFMANPADFIENVLIPWIFGLFVGLLLIYLGIILFIEIVFMGISVLTAGTNIISVLMKWAELHFLALKYLGLFLYGFISIGIKIIESLIKIVLMIVPTKGS